jgi:hypothetical protein
MVSLGPSKTKLAPLACDLHAKFITLLCEISEYERYTSSISNFSINFSNSASSYMGIPFGYSFPASSDGYLLPEIFGICVAVNPMTL